MLDWSKVWLKLEFDDPGKTPPARSPSELKRIVATIGVHRRIAIGHVISLEVRSEFQVVVALQPGKIVDKLILGGVRCCRIAAPIETDRATLAQSGGKVGAAIGVVIKLCGRSRQGCCRLAGPKGKRIVEGRHDELIGEIRAENVCVVKLTVPDWLIALHVQQRIDDTDEVRLEALIVVHANEDLLLVAEVPVDAANDHILPSERRVSHPPPPSCRGRRPLVTGYWYRNRCRPAHKPVFPRSCRNPKLRSILQRTVSSRDWHGGAIKRRGLQQIEHLRIQRNTGCGNGVQGRVLKCGGGKIHKTGRGLDVADAFRIGEEEQLIAEDRAADLGCVLVGNRLLARRTNQVIEEVIRIETVAVIGLIQKAVDTIGAVFRT